MPRVCLLMITVVLAFAIEFASYQWGIFGWGSAHGALADFGMTASLGVAVLLALGVGLATQYADRRFHVKPMALDTQGLLTWAPLVLFLLVMFGVAMMSAMDVMRLMGISYLDLGMVVLVVSLLTFWKLFAVYRLVFPWLLANTSRTMTLLYGALIYAVLELTPLGAGGWSFNTAHFLLVNAAFLGVVYGYWTLTSHRVWPLVVFAVLKNAVMLVQPMTAGNLTLWLNGLDIVMVLLALAAIFFIVKADRQARQKHFNKGDAC